MSLLKYTPGNNSHNSLDTYYLMSYRAVFDAQSVCCTSTHRYEFSIPHHSYCVKISITNSCLQEGLLFFPFHFITALKFSSGHQPGMLAVPCWQFLRKKLYSKIICQGHNVTSKEISFFFLTNRSIV